MKEKMWELRGCRKCDRNNFVPGGHKAFFNMREKIDC
jgi:hypothetical protein